MELIDGHFDIDFVLNQLCHQIVLDIFFRKDFLEMPNNPFGLIPVNEPSQSTGQ